MELSEKLKQAVGKSIGAFCKNGYTSADINHCAHFASHLCGMQFPYTCRQQVGGKHDPANLRVHEIFKQCPKVGNWSDAELNRSQLIFVTLAKNVNLVSKEMVNIPKKHIGIYHNNLVYHYSNTADEVVTEDVANFKKRFDKAYGAGQGYFFGWFPGENLLLSVKSLTESISAEKRFDLLDPVKGIWKARLDCEKDPFLVGRETRDPGQGYYGIFQKTSDYYGPKFKADDYIQEIGQWAVFLEITGYCESQNYFNLINTYDRAKFTFGFYQLAAHTPRDNLILLFRRLASLPALNSYFPELELRGERLFRVDADGSATSLEEEFDTPKEKQLLLFMNYLNPTRKEIERQEVLQAARLIHWSNTDPEMRRVQVQVAAQIVQHKLDKIYDPKLNLDGESDLICAIIADIRHQGRGGYKEIAACLKRPDKRDALLKIGEAQYAERTKTLHAQIEAAEKVGRLGKMRYVSATNGFVPKA
jgi:hypothetical protein